MDTDDSFTLQVADGHLHVAHYGTDPDDFTRTRYRWDIYAGDKLLERGDDLFTGSWMDPGPRAMLGTLLSFLEACAESYAYEMRTGTRGENYDLFCAPVREWAYLHSDELSMARLDIEEPDGE